MEHLIADRDESTQRLRRTGSHAGRDQRDGVRQVNQFLPIHDAIDSGVAQTGDGSRTRMVRTISQSVSMRMWTSKSSGTRDITPRAVNKAGQYHRPRQRQNAAWRKT